MSDADVRTLMQRAQSSGMTDDQIRQQAAEKGMSDGDVSKLQDRINTIRNTQDPNNNDLKKDPDAIKQIVDKPTANSASAGIAGAGGLPIYGSELFNNSNLTFEPNLRIPTPKNYRLGPDDYVQINVYGNSQADWNLPINPDGNIQIPNIGLLNVSAKTIEQAGAMIKSKLVENHYAIGNGSELSVTVGRIRSIKVIMVGELARPGTITISSLATVFNALYQSGGPTANGSFRRIQVIRNSEVIDVLDVYDFLLTGSKKNDIKLEDGDIIRVPTYSVHVSLAGQVKKQAIFEVLPGETLKDVIKFAGGFTDFASTASIKVTQLTDQSKRLKDIPAADFNNYIPLRGDAYVVDRILDSYENRVTIFGAVVRPGPFELEKGLTLSGLIKKASGLRPDAFAAQGAIVRIKSDNTTEIISFDVKGVADKTSPDIELKKEDVVNIPSIFDLRDQYSVFINGQVRKPGIFGYVDNMTLADLIIGAGGFTVAAAPTQVAIARRIKDADQMSKNSPLAKVFTINVDPSFKLSDSTFKLEPFDIVSVYTLPGYEVQKSVTIGGEVLSPGPYTIKSKDERISDLVKRAGGLTIAADIESGRLRRSYNGSGIVGIDLKKALESPGSENDLRLEGGDDLQIPRQQQLVKVSGEVIYPSSVLFNHADSFLGYISETGGFTNNALRRRAYVVYANGRVKATHHFLFFKFYPSVTAGSLVVVPTKPPAGTGISATEIGQIVSGLLASGALLIGIISLTK